MKRTVTLILFVITVFSVFMAPGCYAAIKPNDNIVERRVSLGDFDKIETMRVKVEYTIGTPGEAVLKAPDNVIDRIAVEVKDGTLDVYIKKGPNINGALNAVLTVSSSSLRGVEAYLAGSVNVKSPLVLHREMKVEAATSGSVTLGNITCDGLDVESYTASTVTIADVKSTDDVKIEAFTSGHVNISSLVAEDLKVESFTGGKVNIGGGSLVEVDLEAYTNGKINLGAGFRKGEAEAFTGGVIRTDTANLSKIETATGGKIQNR